MELKRVRAVVLGRVQGVSYRAYTEEQATRLGLTGWVRNKADGTVELEAEGPAGQVEALIEWCRGGPPAARVTAVETQWIAPTGGQADFSVRR